MPQTNIEKRFSLLAPKLLDSFKSRNFEAYYCEDEKEALEKALELIPGDAVVSWGGSESIVELGLKDAVQSRGNEVIDRDTAANPAERMELMRKALLCDVFITSANAVSEDGLLINIDGIGNRVAAQSFGPKMVLYIIGMNKVCQSAEDALGRARTFAAPINVTRFPITTTPCSQTGACANCKAAECVCSYIVTTRFNKVPGRIKIILVGKNLGF